MSDKKTNQEKSTKLKVEKKTPRKETNANEAIKWEKDGNESTRKQTEIFETHDRSLIVIGSKGVGKTTMIHRFLEREDTPRPSLAMDYFYGRKAGKSLMKDLVHVWEVVFFHKEIIISALTGAALNHSPLHITIVVMLDLSKPEELWNFWEDCYTALCKSMKEYYKPEVVKELRKIKLKSFMEGARGGKDWVEEDYSPRDIFPLRLCIIGARYDEFRDMEGVDKEFIGQVLRAVAHVTGATLHYHSAKDSQLLKKTKELLGLFAFKGQCTKASVTDYNKPLHVPAGSDSFAAIDLKYLQDESPVTLEAIKVAYLVRFPQNEKKQELCFEELTNDPNFKEPIIDRLRLQREEEISVSLVDMMESLGTEFPIPEPF